MKDQHRCVLKVKVLWCCNLLFGRTDNLCSVAVCYGIWLCDVQITCCLSQLKEEERKRKALTAKLQEEQRRKQQFVAKKKEKEREEEATIRARLLNESSIEAPEVEEVEKYITKSATLETEVS